MFEDDEIMRIGEVAKLGRVTTGTVRRWVKAGKIPSTKSATGLHLFRRADVMKFLGQGEPRKMIAACSAWGEMFQAWVFMAGLIFMFGCFLGFVWWLIDR